jgi:hypothetical protein
LYSGNIKLKLGVNTLTWNDYIKKFTEIIDKNNALLKR